jgi:hypothetical protein
MAKPFCTCPVHGWTERTESGGPCKKCAEESAPIGMIDGLFGLKIRVSDYLPDDEIFVNSVTAKKITGMVCGYTN